MKVQVLISTMNQVDYTLLDRMNIQTDAIVVNQCEENSVCEFTYKNHLVKWYSLKEKGVGLSRNTALMRATADILLFADDDVVFCDGYEQLVINEFKKCKNTSLIVFNIKCLNLDRYEKETIKTKRIRFYSSLSYGAYRFAVKREVIFHNCIYFSQLYGGGAIYSAGEDNIFLNECLKHKLVCKASNVNIGTVTHNESTWFKGFNEKYFEDLGHLMYVIFRKKALVLTFFMLLKNRKIYQIDSLSNIWKRITSGMENEKNHLRGIDYDK